MTNDQIEPQDPEEKPETEDERQLKELKTGQQVIAALPNLNRNQLSMLYQQWHPMIQLVKQIASRAKPKLEDTSANFRFENWLKQLNPDHSVSNFDRIQLRRAFLAGDEGQTRAQVLGDQIVRENESLLSKVTELQMLHGEAVMLIKDLKLKLLTPQDILMLDEEKTKEHNEEQSSKV